MNVINEIVPTLDIPALRREFPVLDVRVNNKPLVYLDNAATAQKPRTVINALQQYYNGYNANIHRGIHHLAEQATAAYEATRTQVQQFLNAGLREEIIFTRGTTESINLVASSWGRQFLNKDDEIIISTMEHHSNIVPWQIICEEKGARIKVIPINDEGELDLEAFYKLLSPQTRLVAITHVSNALGTINPVREIIHAAHKAGALVLIDGAQSTPHLNINVRDLDCDFFAFSAHKVYGPTGVGVLYGKREILEAMPPYQGGGEMIAEVSFEKTTFNELPYKFEAGTPNIADVIAFRESLVFLKNLDSELLHTHEKQLVDYATQKISDVGGIRIIGTAASKAGVVSFLMDGAHPQDVGVLLDQQGIAVRTGHHCTQPLMDRFRIPGTIRASFAIYNTLEEIDLLAEGLHKAKKMLL
ncbi:MAG TPA: cysteine desulfurase [Ginsengibacter sp.]|nr:cysteine desulfurase [Ginsengibacter sp.]HRP16736.1 cysteine desulfurase [Ginsengibacter sp.]